MNLPIADEATVHEAAAEAVRRGFHLVIDRDGVSKIVPQVFPGMQVLNVAGERNKVAA